jgi:hypothetical protein
MTLLNIASALCAVGVTTWALYLLADLNSAHAVPRFGDMTSAGIALVFVLVFVGLGGWLAEAVVPLSPSILVGLVIAAAIYIFTVAATLSVLRMRRKKDGGMGSMGTSRTSS